MPKLSNGRREELKRKINEKSTKDLANEYSVSVQYVNRLKKEIEKNDEPKNDEPKDDEHFVSFDKVSDGEDSDFSNEYSNNSNNSNDSDNSDDSDGEKEFESNIYDKFIEKQDGFKQGDFKQDDNKQDDNMNLQQNEDYDDFPKSKMKAISKTKIKSKIPKSALKLTKKEIDFLSKKNGAVQNTEQKKMLSELKKQEAEQNKANEAKKVKLCFKLNQMIKIFNKSIIVRGIFGENLDDSKVYQKLKKMRLQDLEELEKTLKNNILLQSQLNGSNSIAENTIAMSSVMIEQILGNFINIKGFSQKMNNQIQNNESLGSALEMYKLECIDWFSTSPSSIIAFTMMMTLMNTYKDNKIISIMNPPQTQTQKKPPTQAPTQAPTPDNKIDKIDKINKIEEINNKFEDL